SYEQNLRYADISIDYRDLTHDFETTANRLWTAVGVTGIDTAALRQWVVRPEEQKNLMDRRASLGQRMSVVAQHLRRRFGGGPGQVRTAAPPAAVTAETPPSPISPAVRPAQPTAAGTIAWQDRDKASARERGAAGRGRSAGSVESSDCQARDRATSPGES